MKDLLVAFLKDVTGGDQMPAAVVAKLLERVQPEVEKLLRKEITPKAIGEATRAAYEAKSQSPGRQEPSGTPRK